MQPDEEGNDNISEEETAGLKIQEVSSDDKKIMKSWKILEIDHRNMQTGSAE